MTVLLSVVGIAVASWAVLCTLFVRRFLQRSPLALDLATFKETDFAPEPSAIDRLAAIEDPRGEAAQRVRARDEWLAQVARAERLVCATAMRLSKGQ